MLRVPVTLGAWSTAILTAQLASMAYVEGLGRVAVSALNYISNVNDLMCCYLAYDGMCASGVCLTEISECGLADNCPTEGAACIFINWNSALTSGFCSTSPFLSMASDGN